MEYSVIFRILVAGLYFILIERIFNISSTKNDAV